MLHDMFADCQRRALWQIVTAKAGAGKSTAVKSFRDRYGYTGVFGLECGPWGKTQFLKKLVREIGVEPARGQATAAPQLFDQVIERFSSNHIAGQTPLLLLDQANSLSTAALMLLIHLYNSLSGRLGVVLLGTFDLKKSIQRGVGSDRSGFDELERRFGRAYTSVPGCDLDDITRICLANGVTDTTAIQHIWAKLPKSEQIVGEGRGRIRTVTHDLGQMTWLVEKVLLSDKSTKSSHLKIA